MITSIELQVISRILTSQDENEVSTLCSYDESFYSVFKPHITFILNHRSKYNQIPDVFTFQSEFEDVTLVQVKESLSYLTSELRKNKQHIILLETFNKLKDLGSGDVTDAWKYLSAQCDRVSQLDDTKPLDLIKDAKERSDQIVDFSKYSRIPTGFDEIDKLMYGGLSTVEELVLIVARTNNGKSWVCVRMMESAQRHGFPVLYYSPEMQASFLGTRFDTWRGHFQNSQLYRGHYSPEYLEYLDNLKNEAASAYIIEDKDVEGGTVTVAKLENLVRRYGIKELIVDGLSYLSDSSSVPDHVKYQNIVWDLFKLSKKYGCAVVVAVQANRETRESKDDKGEPFPTLYNVSASDSPARIATQAFSLRQVFDKHVLDIRLEKSRNANNQKPVMSYAWDINTGNMRYLPGGEDDAITQAITPNVVKPNIVTTHVADTSILDDDDFEEDVEF